MKRPIHDQIAAFHAETRRGVDPDVMEDLGYVSPERLPEVLAAKRSGSMALVKEVSPADTKTASVSPPTALGTPFNPALEWPSPEVFRQNFAEANPDIVTRDGQFKLPVE